MIYLDHAATTPVPKAVADAMYTVLTEQYANPNAQYPFGQEIRRSVEDWRAVIAKAVGCEANQLFFTSCGTEGDNWAIRAACWQNRHVGRHIVTTAVEHHAVLNCCQQLEQEGWEVTTILPDQNGDISAEAVLSAVRPDTALVSVMMVNNELGSIYPIADIAKGLKAVNEKTLLHTDAVQGFLKVPFSAKALGADFIAISGHKVGAPKGIGALFVRDSQRQTLHPPYVGGHQERGMRPGTENTPYIVGLGLAAAKGAQRLRTKGDHLHALNRQLRTGLAELPGITLNSPDDAVDEVVNFSTGCINSQTFINYLNTRAVYVSGGSACDKGEPSHTLLAMGCADLTVRTALRVSFCADNTAEDVDALLAGLRDGLQELQHI